MKKLRTQEGFSAPSSAPADVESCGRAPEYQARPLLRTATVAAWDVQCPGLCRVKADEEMVQATRLVFPYRGVFVSWVGAKSHVADSNQMLVLNADEPYQVSHPVAGGDATLAVAVDPATWLEVVPSEDRLPRERPALNRSIMQIDARTQALAARLRQRLSRGSVGYLESEALALQLARHALTGSPVHPAGARVRQRQRMAERVKLLLSADPWRRWTLADISREVNVTPVYLTDAFRKAEGIPLYRYHLRLRLAIALTVVAESDDLAALAVDLGFYSHSHFSSAFKKTFGCSPSDFKKSVTGLRNHVATEYHMMSEDLDSAAASVSHSVAMPGLPAKDVA
ncbi:AraC family transcriptional regulator [Mycobacterium sp. 1245852.3]|uniref:helix-turn-helix transcriptional regulator n=1 Tax=Mycobacterium sp. 1245852.3 TaxID=1856860 RepID=UPI0018D4D65B|nr:AraC family transcriptional regulator [Mycobacterium sp. 1245852.3]